MNNPGVSIITCTNQPGFHNNIIRNYLNQRYKRKELIIVLNNDRLNIKEWRKKTAGKPRISVHQVPERISLGQCLNCGISIAQYPIIAKFDHDDYYSPYYLREQVRMLKRRRVPIIGKHACLVYLAASRKLIIRSPQEKNKFVSFVQGGTILFRKNILRAVRFSDLSLDEDVKFLRDSARKGYRIYATTPYNYVYVRRKDKRTHTWRASDQSFLAGSQPVAVTSDFRRMAARKY